MQEGLLLYELQLEETVIRKSFIGRQKMRAVFLKNLKFSRTSTQVSDFSGLDLMFAEAHARGFAPL